MNLKIFIIVFIIFIVLLIVSLITGAIYIQSQKTTMNQNWPTYKCKPYVLPFAGILVGPSDVNPTQNFTECMWVMNKSFFDVLMEPFVKIMQMIVGVLSSLQGDIQEIRKMTSYLRDSVESIAIDIYQKVYDAYARIARLFVVIETTFTNLFSFFKSLFDVMLYIYYTFMSLWNGPVGGMLRFFCFHPNTPITMADRTEKRISEIKIGDNILFGKKVRAVLQFDASRIQLYQYQTPNMNNRIIVSGEHWVLENQKWKQVKNSEYIISLPLNENPQYIYCLITENNLIHIHNTIFKDYEEDNHYTNWIYNTLTSYFQQGSIIHINPERTLDSSYFGSYFYSLTNVRMNDGTYKLMQDIEIGDILFNNNRVLTKITGNSRFLSWYIYNNDLVSSNVMNLGNNLVKNDRDSKITFYPYELDECYSIITETNIIETEYNVFRDFEMTRDIEIQDYITYVIHSEN
jgi:hypothetical protein